MARPIGFDRSQVLERATRLFWDKGYCATSVADLVQATKLRPGSLYGAFDSKEGLFLAALDFYGEQSLRKLRALLAGSGDPLQGIARFLRQLAGERGRRIGQRGCFLVNTALEVAPHNRRVRQRVRRSFDAIEDCFARAFARALDDGLLQRDRDPRILARSLMVTIWGIRVMQRLGTDSAGVQAVVDEYLATFGEGRH